MSDHPTILPIIKKTRANEAFRDEIITGKKSQVVLMTIQPSEEIGMEVHEDHDQILVIVEGQGHATLGDKNLEFGPDDLIFVHAGTRHNIVNSGNQPLRLYTVYAPPEHAAGTRHETKAQADAAEHHD
jgi:mannose-6-phosphate isomerase-like protein (cupin superfamily)